jgi:hypothetical protein
VGSTKEKYSPQISHLGGGVDHGIAALQQKTQPGFFTSWRNMILSGLGSRYERLASQKQPELLPDAGVCPVLGAWNPTLTEFGRAGDNLAETMIQIL